MDGVCIGRRLDYNWTTTRLDYYHENEKPFAVASALAIDPSRRGRRCDESNESSKAIAAALEAGPSPELVASGEIEQ